MNKRFINKQEEITRALKECGSIAVCKPVNSVEAINLAENLLHHGIKAMEIAYRGESYYSIADECINTIRALVPEMLVGAATVTSVPLCKRARASGASFVLSAGFNPEVVKYCIKHHLPVFPGVMTPGEIEACMNLGLKTLKLFPVELCGGVDYLKALSGPYPEINFIVSGGLNSENSSEYSSCKNVLAISGSFLNEVCNEEKSSFFSN